MGQNHFYRGLIQENEIVNAEQVKNMFPMFLSNTCSTFTKIHELT